MDERDKAPRRAVGDWSFLFKLIGALALAGLAQSLFLFERAGATIGGFALLLLSAAALLRPVMWRDRRARSWPPPSSRWSFPPIRAFSRSFSTGSC